MDWLAQNWIWVVFFVLFVGMHLVGHGGHGGHGGCCGGDEQGHAGGERPGKDKSQSHQH